MTGHYRLTQNLDTWRQQQQRAFERRERRAFRLCCGLFMAMGFLAAWVALGCAQPHPYDDPDYTDSGVGCVDNCLEPSEAQR